MDDYVENELARGRAELAGLYSRIGLSELWLARVGLARCDGDSVTQITGNEEVPPVSIDRKGKNRAE